MVDKFYTGLYRFKIYFNLGELSTWSNSQLDQLESSLLSWFIFFIQAWDKDNLMKMFVISCKVFRLLLSTKHMGRRTKAALLRSLLD